MFHENMEYSLFVSVISLFVAGIGLVLAIAIFTTQQRQSRKLSKLVTDVHGFAEDQKTIRDSKRRKYASSILFGLGLIENHFHGIIVQQIYRDFNDKTMEDKERINIQLRSYEKAQEAFTFLKITYDDILEIFNNEIENQYRQAWMTIAIESTSSEDHFKTSENAWKKIEKIETEFNKLKNLLLSYVSDKTKQECEGLFNIDHEKLKVKIKSNIQN